MEQYGTFQSDIHSPATTIREALYFSARCRLMNVNKAQLAQFVEEVLSPLQCGGSIMLLSDFFLPAPCSSGLQSSTFCMEHAFLDMHIWQG